MSLLGDGARLVDAADGTELAGEDLRTRVAGLAAELSALPVGVVFARTAVDVPSVLRYLGAFTAGRRVALLDAGEDREVLLVLVAAFRP
ncbi:long-chain fatty acid--CoA ligase, partial [Umezawaea endophytica]